GVGNLKLIPPTRVLDTRGDAGGPVGVSADGASGALTAGSTRRFRLGGQTFGGVTFPPDTIGIVAHVTLSQDQPSGGYVTLFPGDARSAPIASTVNPVTPVAASLWANGIPTSGSNAGTEAIFSQAAVDVIVDVVGYFRNGQTVSAPVPSWLTYVNSFRDAANLPRLTENAAYSAGDQIHAKYMVDTGYFGHCINGASDCPGEDAA